MADFLEQKKFPRLLATLMLLILTFGLIFLFGLILIPTMVGEIQELIGRVPGMVDKLSVFVEENLPKLLTALRIDPVKFQQNLEGEVPARFQALLTNMLKSVSGIGSLLSQIFNIILIPILTFYLLKDFNRIRDWMLNLVPRRHRSASYFYAWRMNRILGGYLRGQFIACSIVAGKPGSAD